MNLFFTFFCGIIGIVFMLVGSLFIWSGLPRTRVVTCGRTEDKTIDCRVKSATAGFTEREATLKKLQTVETFSAQVAGEDGDFTSFGVNLIFANQTETLDNMSEPNARALKSKFENFINSPQQESFNVENRRRDWTGILVGAAAISLISLTVAALRRKTEIDSPTVEKRAISDRP